MLHFAWSLSSVAQMVQKLWPILGLWCMFRSINLDLFLAITFEPIELQSSATMQNVAFFILFHFVPKSFSLKLIIFIKNDKMHYLDQFRPIFDRKRRKNPFSVKTVDFRAKRITGTPPKTRF